MSQSRNVSRSSMSPTRATTRYEFRIQKEAFWMSAISRILWIKGDPGKGETMLLCGIIDELNKTHKKPVYFFCQAADHRLNTATAVLRGLIYLLVKQQPTLVTYLRKEYMHAGKRLFEDANAWYALSTMLIAMLADPLSGNQILIVDALDECVTDLQRILDFISKSSSSRAKWIVSSRNLSTIEQGLDSSTRKVRLSLELNEKAISAAVRVYIQHKVAQLASKNKYDYRTTELVRSHLTSNANDTFLWVALVLNSFPPGLDALYGRMMVYMFESDDAVLCRQILAAALVVFRPLLLKELVALIPSLKEYKDDLDTLTEIVGACGSFLTLRAGVLDFVHKSAKDFLLETASGKILLHGIEYEHRNIFSSSMEVLYGTLRRNVYGLRHLGHSIDEISPPRQDPLASARYCCVYWVNHFCASESLGGTKANQKTDAAAIYEFLHKKFIHWLEALTMMRSLSEGVMATRTLEKWAEKSKGSLRLLDFIRDAQRFILSHRTVFEITPMQLYASALVFSPTRSLGHKDKITSIAFTANDQRLITGSTDGIIKIWNPAQNTSVSMGRRLASKLWDKAIRMWDPARNECVLPPEEAHSSSIMSLQLLANGQRLSSKCSGGICKIWDTATGACVSTPKGLVNSEIIFSAESQWLASKKDFGSIQVEIKICNALTGMCVSTIKLSGVVVVNLSADGRRLASCAYEAEAHIWNTATGAYISTLKGVRFERLVFSADGRRLASCHQDGKVGIWDTTTGALMSRFETTHTVPVNFSANGQRLACVGNGRVEIWDTTTFAHVLNIHDESFEHWQQYDDSSLVFSADGQRLAAVGFENDIMA
ncbi:NACHT and WD40 domain protein [Colletotrichum kahawae]|uniref:NACHT and WD40 domain protein n=1 Tax=Colletotrichum kahawae TaxID=34407 RepID=A0AAE0CZL9_COLKA|nr:NACHT and WD40 domain protein [Colletotrichum kahawae]